MGFIVVARIRLGGKVKSVSAVGASRLYAACCFLSRCYDGLVSLTIEQSSNPALRLTAVSRHLQSVSRLLLRFTGDRKSRKDRKEERKARKGGGGASGAGAPSAAAPTAEELAAVNARPKDAPRTWVRLGHHCTQRGDTSEGEVKSEGKRQGQCRGVACTTVV